MSILEQLIREDFGLVYNGEKYARSEDHDSLVLNLEQDVFFWNSRNIVGDAYVYLTRVRGYSPNDAREVLKSYRGYEGSTIHHVTDGKEVVTYPKLVDIFHQNIWEVDRVYFHLRKISDETISRFRLGYYNGFYTIPFYQDGIFKQIQLRRDQPKKIIRNYYKGVGAVLFNSDIMKITDTVFFTEAPTSALAMNQVGLPTVSMNAGAESFMSEWAGYFVHQKRINLLFDNDSAGVFGALKIAKILGVDRCKIYTFSDYPDKGYDANDFFMDGGSKDELLQLLQEKSLHAYEMEDMNGRGKKKFPANRFR